MPIWYHVSPNNFSQFQPKYSRKFSTKGIFFCPTLYDLVHDWVGTIISRKKGATHKKYCNGLFVKEGYYPVDNYYLTCYLYHVWVRPDIARKLKEVQAQKVHEQFERLGEITPKNENIFWRLTASWCWGPEVFVPEEYFRPEYIRIVKKEKLNSNDLLNRIPWRIHTHTKKENKNKNPQ